MMLCLYFSINVGTQGMVYEIVKDDYLVSDDNGRLDVEVIHHFLSVESYWAENIPRTVVEKSIAHSLCFGVYHQGRQVGFARLITDRATYGYLADVFIIVLYRGKGLSKWLIECILAHPDLQGLRRISLATRDAHELYRQFGFGPLEDAAKFMQIRRPTIYKEHPFS